MRVRPSGLSRLVNCPGSLRMIHECDIPEVENSAATEGTRLHEIAADALSGLDTFGGEIPDEIKDYVDYCDSILHSDKIACNVERTLKILDLHEDCEGTPDFYAYDDRHIEVVDLKTGRRPIKDYWQLIAYAVGVIGLEDTRNEIRLTYVQSDAYHEDGSIRTEILTLGEFNDLAHYLKQKIDVAHTENAPLISGDHCYRCPRQFDCPANTNAAANVIDSASDVTRTTNINIDALGRELEVLERSEQLLKERLINIRSVMEYRIKAGDVSNTHAFSTTSGKRSYNCKNEDVVSYCELLDIEPYEKVLKSPAKLEKAGFSKKVMKGLTKTPAYVKLTRIDFEKTKKVFKL